MNIFIILFAAVVVTASTASISSIYIPPVTDNSLPVQEYIPPDNNEGHVILADDGYRYRVVRRLKLRVRRDVNELPTSEYLPAVEGDQEEISLAQPLAVMEAAPEEKTTLAKDGYRYKTIRRLIYRQRRDVNKSTINEYLPPADAAVAQPVSEEINVIESVPEVKTDLSDDGYHYKTVRRLKYRQRREISELPEYEYLPPTEVKKPASEYVPVVDAVPEDKTELGEDGYRYKTVRRLKYRQRRDVSELLEHKYLPPNEMKKPASEYVPVVNSVPEDKTELGRDVSAVPKYDYLPPTEVKKPASKYVPVVDAVPEDKTELGEDGYRYKTVRRLKYRQRREVSESPEYEYLPPTEVEKPASEYVPVVDAVPEDKTELGEDGYHYKTTRRLKYRRQ